MVLIPVGPLLKRIELVLADFALQKSYSSVLTRMEVCKLLVIVGGD